MSFRSSWPLRMSLKLKGFQNSLRRCVSCTMGTPSSFSMACQHTHTRGSEHIHAHARTHAKAAHQHCTLHTAHCTYRPGILLNDLPVQQGHRDCGPQGQNGAGTWAQVWELPRSPRCTDQSTAEILPRLLDRPAVTAAVRVDEERADFLGLRGWRRQPGRRARQRTIRGQGCSHAADTHERKKQGPWGVSADLGSQVLERGEVVRDLAARVVAELFPALAGDGRRVELRHKL